MSYQLTAINSLSASADMQGMLPEIVRMNRDPDFQPSPEVVELLPTQEDCEAMQAGFADNPSGAENFQVMMGKLGRLITNDWGERFPAFRNRGARTRRDWRP